MHTLLFQWHITTIFILQRVELTDHYPEKQQIKSNSIIENVKFEYLFSQIKK